MAQAKVYSKSWCPYCVRAKQLLTQLGVDFEEIDVERDPAQLAEMIRASGRRTVPQIWIGATHVGGCDELFALQRAGQLAALLHLTDSNTDNSTQ